MPTPTTFDKSVEDRVPHCILCEERYPYSMFDDSEPVWDVKKVEKALGMVIPVETVCKLCKIQAKTCTNCGETYPAVEHFFYKKKRGKYGLHSVCKECRAKQAAQYHQDNIDKRREQLKTYYYEHREEQAARRKAKRKAAKEARRQHGE